MSSDLEPADDAGMTMEQFSDRAQRALERFLDHLSRMTATELAELSAGLRLPVALAMDLGDLDSAGCADALAEMVEALGLARAAMEARP